MRGLGGSWADGPSAGMSELLDHGQVKPRTYSGSKTVFGADEMNENKGNSMASDGIKWVAARVLSGISAFSRGKQNRLNLGADVAAIDQLQEKGLSIARYRGLSIDVETFDRAVEEEDERQVDNVVNTLQQADSVVDWEKVDLDKFNPEFAYRWGAEASNVSDETLQNLWARLMKGELESPGSVSNDTMTVARDMTKACAEKFQLFCSAALYDPTNGRPRVVVGCGNPGRDSLQPFGLSFDVLMRLVHHRLIIGDMNTRLNCSGSPKSLFLGTHQGQVWILRSKSETSSLQINGLLFTPAGEQLACVVEQIPVPEYTRAMFEDLGKQGWTFTPVAMNS